MPRQKKDVWYSFKEIIVGGVKRAKCKTCGFEVVNNAARMEKHMRDCRNVDDDDDIQEQSTSSATTTSSAPPAPKKRQTALNVISTNPTRQHESDILVTRYFIATNTPFNAASNKHLAKLVQFLRPGTTVPDRRRIGGELLDEIYASEQTKVKRMVSGSNVTLAIDGWSTLTNEPVLGVSFYHCGKCYLVNTMSTIGESHTTEYLVQVTSMPERTRIRMKQDKPSTTSVKRLVKISCRSSQITWQKFLPITNTFLLRVTKRSRVKLGGEVDFDWDSRKNWSTMHRHWPMLSPPVQDWSGVSQLSDSLMENSEVLWASRRLESWLFSLNNSMSDFKTQFCF